MSSIFQTPILFLIFNRPDTTNIVFQKIREIRPKKLYVAADGPRIEKMGEVDKCEQVKQLVLSQIDWECEVKTLFRTENLGCKIAVSQAIDWFFENEEQGIILEDDCLPDISFFGFCEELLIKYEKEEKILHISGDNFQNGIKRGSRSFYYSSICHIWGWATWRRAWKLYDREVKKWSNYVENKQIRNAFLDAKMQQYYIDSIQKAVDNEIDTWDLQWAACILINEGVAIMPNVNLISNIGFGEEGTHTKNVHSKLSNLATTPVKYPLVYPSSIEIDQEADKYAFYAFFYTSKWQLFKYNIKKQLKSFF